MNRHHLAALPAALACALLLGACASDEDAPAAAASDSSSEVSDDLDAAYAGAELGADIRSQFSSCDDVEPAVAPYIDGLVANASNGVDEYSVHCLWETADTVTSLSEIRSVQVMIEPNSGEVLDAATIEAVGLEVVPDSTIEAAGGSAHTMSQEIAVAAATVTSVELPEVKVTISGGRWDNYPSLDADASVAVAKQLLGL
ncbi:hypothetical protein [Rhodococcus chondri]|uniref:Lipoprotein n=1 Tax=Rhodococcus chondri TaxID=3065941 RepID=A0ABU7JSJ7_9NOCA|nr:hypothetical protein [Rhodococcus sp. CC-R104]MEE2033001.1 hypothetical protein [Rhodococcus sp. CC-R104]